MTPEPRSTRSLAQLNGQLRFYKTASLILLCAVILLAAMMIAGGRRNGRAIKIDDELVCLVRDQAAAERVHAQLLEQGRGKLPGEASLEQQWSDVPWPVDNPDDVLSVPDAVKCLQDKGVVVFVSAWNIEVNGVQTVNLPAEAFAQDVLTRVKLQYVPEDEKLVESTFLEDVKIVETQTAAGNVLSEIAAAVEALGNTKSDAKTYKVKAGEFPEKIAADHKMTIDQFYRLNPQTRGRTIHPGDTVKVAPAMTGITVKTVTEVTETVDVAPEVEKLHSVHVPRGETRVSTPGVPGKKLVVKHKTYNNDRVVLEQTISSQIVEAPSPKRVLVGTADGSGATGGSGSEG